MKTTNIDGKTYEIVSEKKDELLLRLVPKVEMKTEIPDVDRIRIFTHGTKEELYTECVDAGYCPVVFGGYVLVGNGNVGGGCFIGVKKK